MVVDCQQKKIAFMNKESKAIETLTISTFLGLTCRGGLNWQGGGYFSRQL